MRVIAVVGTASGSGKTGVACAILRSFPGLGAVKISPREGAVRIERGAGRPGKDTARYAESGAIAVARIVGPRERVAAGWEAVRGEFERLPAVVVEGAGALALPAERFTVLVAAPGALGVRPERDGRLAAAADWIVVAGRRGGEAGERVPAAISRAHVPWSFFDFDDGDRIEARLIEVLRAFISRAEVLPEDPWLARGFSP